MEKLQEARARRRAEVAAVTHGGAASELLASLPRSPQFGAFSDRRADFETSSGPLGSPGGYCGAIAVAGSGAPCGAAPGAMAWPPVVPMPCHSASAPSAAPRLLSPRPKHAVPVVAAAPAAVPLAHPAVVVVPPKDEPALPARSASGSQAGDAASDMREQVGAVEADLHATLLTLMETTVVHLEAQMDAVIQSVDERLALAGVLPAASSGCSGASMEVRSAAPSPHLTSPAPVVAPLAAQADRSAGPATTAEAQRAGSGHGCGCGGAAQPTRAPSGREVEVEVVVGAAPLAQTHFPASLPSTGGELGSGSPDSGALAELKELSARVAALGYEQQAQRHELETRLRSADARISEAIQAQAERWTHCEGRLSDLDAKCDGLGREMLEFFGERLSVVDSELSKQHERLTSSEAVALQLQSELEALRAAEARRLPAAAGTGSGSGATAASAATVAGGGAASAATSESAANVAAHLQWRFVELDRRVSMLCDQMRAQNGASAPCAAAPSPLPSAALPAPSAPSASSPPPPPPPPPPTATVVAAPMARSATASDAAAAPVAASLISAPDVAAPAAAVALPLTRVPPALEVTAAPAPQRRGRALHRPTSPAAQREAQERRSGAEAYLLPRSRARSDGRTPVSARGSSCGAQASKSASRARSQG
eukprot:TRINITY_DN6443_c0_g2_i1.p1 TRINITY_DN6443_c0_g2~~TRINITY_DN6443_c0_g2_i1.p1  ORF type:complete len:656 (-),score=176.69 TRINITY_DN6443_c0_g2_i1:83-2050(-)